MCLGLAVSHFLLCRASELCAYANGQVDPELCMIRECICFFREGGQVGGVGEQSDR